MTSEVAEDTLRRKEDMAKLDYAEKPENQNCNEGLVWAALKFCQFLLYKLLNSMKDLSSILTPLLHLIMA